MAKLIKRVVSFVSAIAVGVSMLGTTVSADAMSYTERNSAMIQFFAGKDAQGEPTEEDIRMFGIYMSNFYEPFKTNMNDMKACMTTACEKLMGGSIPSESQNYIDALIEGVIKNITAKSLPLKLSDQVNDLSFLAMLKSDDGTSSGQLYWTSPSAIQSESDTDAPEEPDVEETPTEETPADEAPEDSPEGDNPEEDNPEDSPEEEPENTQQVPSVLWAHQSANGVTMTTKPTDPAVYCDFALSYCMANSYENFASFLGNEVKLETPLAITPFGDIVTTDDYTVIIPGCINPYTWRMDGLCLPLINDLTLKKIKGTIPIGAKDGDETRTWLERINKTKESSGADLFNIVGLQLTAPAYGYYALDANNVYENGSPVNDPSTVANTTQIVAFVNQSAFGGKVISSLNNTEDTDMQEYVRQLTSALRDVAVPLDYVQQRLYLFDSGELNYEPTNTLDIFTVSDGSSTNGLASLVKHNVADVKDVKAFIASPTVTIDTSNWWFNIGDKKVFPVGIPASEKNFAYTYNEIKPDPSILGIAQMDGVNFYPQIFYTYMMMGYNHNLPNIDKDAISALGDMINQNTGGKDLSDMQEKALKRMLDLTEDGISDTKGNFLNSFLNSFLLKAHKSMLGIRSNNIATVSNSGMAYSGFTGHVTTPTLKDFPFTANIINNYDKVYLVLMSLVIVCVAIMFICHMKTWQQCITLTLIMAVCLAVPQGTIDGAITLSNTVSNGMYANRFNYWAMIQHQQELQSVRDAGNSGNDLRLTLVQNLNMVENYYASDGVQLRWMSAKKGDAFEKVFGDSLDDGTIMGSGAFKALFSGYFKQESYSNDPLATYVYRTYSSIATAAKEHYILLQNAEAFGGSVDGNLLQADEGLNAITMGIVPSPAGDYYKPNLVSTSFRTAFLDTGDTDSRISNRDVAVGNHVGFAINGDTSTDSNLHTFLLYSESPFYYFYNVFMNTTANGVTPSIDGDAETGEVKNFLKVMLSEDMFKVTQIDSPMYGMTKDFMDMEGLFTYVVPYMHSANMIVGDFTALRGTDYAKYGSSETVSVNTMNDIEDMWNLYCPWVDALYETSCLNDSIKVMDKKYVVADAFNPYYYTSKKDGVQTGRPMAFGEADMQAKGITLGDATVVETKIHNVLEDTYLDIRYLANYAAFSDEVLATAAAMMATFNFNQEFSESNIFGNSIVLYPQGYELKTFSYDAFLRLILLNSTGQSVMAKTDIYTAMLENTSFLTGILLLIVDFLAIYVLPTAKLVFIILVFVLSLLMLLTCFLQGVENAPKTVLNAIVVPMLKFLAISIAHAFATAILMGEGLTELVGSKTGALVTNDPTITLLLLAVINGFASLQYIKILFKLIKDGMVWARETVVAMTGLLKNLADTVSKGVQNIATHSITVNADGSISNNNSGGNRAYGSGSGFNTGTRRLATAAAIGGLRQIHKGNELSRRFDKKLGHVVNTIERSNGANIDNVSGEQAPKSLKAKARNAVGSAVDNVKEKASNTMANYKQALNNVKGAWVGNSVVMEAKESLKFRRDKIKETLADTKVGKTVIRAKEIKGKVDKGRDALLSGEAAVAFSNAASERLRAAADNSKFVRGKQAARAEAEIRQATGNLSAETVEKQADDAARILAANEQAKERMQQRYDEASRAHEAEKTQFEEARMKLDSDQARADAFLDAELEQIDKATNEITDAMVARDEAAKKAVMESMQNSIDALENTSKKARKERQKAFNAELSSMTAKLKAEKYNGDGGSAEFKRDKAKLAEELRQKHGYYESYADAKKAANELKQRYDEISKQSSGQIDFSEFSTVLGKKYDEYKKQSDVYTEELSKCIDAAVNLKKDRAATHAEFARQRAEITKNLEVFTAKSDADLAKLRQSIDAKVTQMDASSAELTNKILIADAYKDKIAQVKLYTDTYKVDSAKFGSRVQKGYIGENRG